MTLLLQNSNTVSSRRLPPVCRRRHHCQGGMRREYPADHGYPHCCCHSEHMVIYQPRKLHRRRAFSGLYKLLKKEHLKRPRLL